jgi:hypothetical protein
MKPWDVLRREAAGLRRSIQYDLIRRAEAQRTIAARRPTEVLDADRARRAFTVTGVSLVLAGGAAGTYLAVAGGLGLFGTDEAATALPIDGPAVVLPAGTPAVPRPHPASPQPVPRSARPARPAGAAAAVARRAPRFGSRYVRPATIEWTASTSTPSAASLST